MPITSRKSVADREKKAKRNSKLSLGSQGPSGGASSRLSTPDSHADSERGFDSMLPKNHAPIPTNGLESFASKDSSGHGSAGGKSEVSLAAGSLEQKDIENLAAALSTRVSRQLEQVILQQNSELLHRLQVFSEGMQVLQIDQMSDRGTSKSTNGHGQHHDDKSESRSYSSHSEHSQLSDSRSAKVEIPEIPAEGEDRDKGFASELGDHDLKHKQKAQAKAESVSSLRKLYRQGTQESQKPVGLLRRVVESWQFEAVFAMLITSNSIILGVQVELDATGYAQEVKAPFFVIGATYTCLFVAEILARMAAEQISFFWESKNVLWNYLDLLVVIASLVEQIADLTLGIAAEYDGSAMATNMRLLRMIRITRLVRITRIVKVVRFIRALRCLVNSILTSLKTLVWSVLLLIIVIYLFALLFTITVTDHIEFAKLAGDYDPTSTAALRLLFGSLHMSMHTLFRCVLGGLDWGLAAEPLIEISWFWGYMLTFYVGFSVLAMLNSMIGVCCQNAIESAHQDHEQLVEAIRHDEKRFAQTISSLFTSMDSSGEGTLTLFDFEQKFQDLRVRAFFQSLGLEPADAWSLFKLLDSDSSGSVSVQQFLHGCLRFRGPAKALDIASLIEGNRFLTSKATAVDNKTKQLAAQLGNVEFRLERMLYEMKTASTQFIQAEVKNAIHDVFFT